MPFVSTNVQLWPESTARKFRRSPWAPMPYFMDVQVAAGLGRTVRLGFNPGELLDLVLGCANIDIYRDDLESNQRKEKAKSSEAASPKSAGS